MDSESIDDNDEMARVRWDECEGDWWKDSKVYLKDIRVMHTKTTFKEEEELVGAVTVQQTRNKCYEY